MGHVPLPSSLAPRPFLVAHAHPAARLGATVRAPQPPSVNTTHRAHERRAACVRTCTPSVDTVRAPCVKFGAPCGPGVAVRAGQKKAREMWFLARMYTAQQALDMGLVNTVRRARM